MLLLALLLPYDVLYDEEKKAYVGVIAVIDGQPIKNASRLQKLERFFIGR